MIELTIQLKTLKSAKIREINFCRKKSVKMVQFDKIKCRKPNIETIIALFPICIQDISI